jgi:crossover junction endodeoxyribonuclease RusA
MLISAEGREYRQTVAGLIRWPEAKPMFAGSVAVSVVMTPPDRRRRDLDNVFKALLDSMTSAGVWGDDSQIDALSIRRAGVCKKRGGVTVEVMGAPV